MKYLYLLMAIIFICTAHYIRVLRWQLFVKIYEKPNKKNLIQSLTFGYVLNSFLPFKLGTYSEVWYSGRKMKNGKPFALSTVVIDRYLDIIVVGAIFVLFTFFGLNDETTKDSVFFYMGVAGAVLVLTGVAFCLRSILKKAMRLFAGIFNENIELKILRCAWALIWNFKDIFLKINKMYLIMTTVGMWLLYLVSYFFFAEFLTTIGNALSWTDIFTILFAKNSIEVGTMGVSTIGGNINTLYPVYMLIYIFVPLIIMFGISLLLKDSKADGEKDGNEYLNLLPHLDPKERLNFLESYFSDRNKDYLKTYLRINQSISIIRDYSAGSNATTMLCMNENRTFFRKYAFGADGDKLYEQILWIKEHKDCIPLPEILEYGKEEGYCYYDMPYQSNAEGLFNYVHSMPIEQGWEMLRKSLECLEKSIYRINVKKADEATIEKYIETKVEKNIKKIVEAKRIKKLQNYDEIIINGIAYKNINYYRKYLSKEYLTNVFKDDMYADIHGDLTIENIICTRDNEGKDDFYIIDPNTGNVHDSPNLDYGKMLQSIHGGYEFLMTTKKVDVCENRINFLFTKSSSYIELHNRLRKYMEENFSKERVRSIYFHEIVHWLRLMPYKIEKDGERALLFYAGLLMVLNDVIHMYGDM